MKIVLTPNLSAYKARLEALATNNHELHDSMLALEHMQKRQQAEAVAMGADPTEEFVEAATIEGMTPQELAAHITSKPESEHIARGNNRRRMIKRIRNATSTAELDAIMNELNPPTEVKRVS